jgi:hypothetical protein
LGGRSQILHVSKSHFTPGHLLNRETDLFLAIAPLHSHACHETAFHISKFAILRACSEVLRGFAWLCVARRGFALLCEVLRFCGSILRLTTDLVVRGTRGGSAASDGGSARRSVGEDFSRGRGRLLLIRGAFGTAGDGDAVAHHEHQQHLVVVQAEKVEKVHRQEGAGSRRG